MFQEDVTLTDKYNCPNNNAINAEHAQLVNYSTELPTLVFSQLLAHAINQETQPPILAFPAQMDN
jgi:hypothetical protein